MRVMHAIMISGTVILRRTLYCLLSICHACVLHVHVLINSHHNLWGCCNLDACQGTVILRRSTWITICHVLSCWCRHCSVLFVLIYFDHCAHELLWYCTYCIGLFFIFYSCPPAPAYQRLGDLCWWHLGASKRGLHLHGRLARGGMNRIVFISGV